MSGKYFYSVVNLENILRPIFTVAHILNQNLLAQKTYWICDPHVLRRFEWVSVSLIEAYVPRREQ